MKLSEQFRIPEQPQSLWTFFERPEDVARCLPGVESVTVHDEDNVTVRATQSIGPLHATFDAKVTVFERVPGEMIRFRAVGRTVRGAAGNVRAENTVRLQPDGDGTTVVFEGDLILAGALGSVGQKVVAKQTAKVTSQFASNLQRALSGEPPEQPVATAPAGPAASAAPTGRPGELQPAFPVERWCRLSVALSAAGAAFSFVAMIRSFRGAR